MIILKRGDRLPTVAVLQHHLNRRPSTPEFLVVDGIFGPKTERAVVEFRKAAGLGRTRTVDYNLWKRIVGSTWQFIDSVDRSDHNHPNQRIRQRVEIQDHLDLIPFGQTVVEQFGMSDGTVTALRQIRTRARQGQVVLLRLHAHGSPGSMSISQGVLGGATSLHWFFFRAIPEPMVWRPLWLLRSMFAPFGSVELHGCRVAFGEKGEFLLRTMANTLGVPVTGGFASQYGGGQTTYRFEGRTRTVCPSGESLRDWAHRLLMESHPTLSPST